VWQEGWQNSKRNKAGQPNQPEIEFSLFLGGLKVVLDGENAFVKLNKKDNKFVLGGGPQIRILIEGKI